MFTQAKECQVLPANHQKLGERDGAHSLSRPSEETKDVSTLVPDFWPPEWWDNKFLLFKLLRLRYFMMVDLANRQLR